MYLEGCELEPLSSTSDNIIGYYGYDTVANILNTSTIRTTILEQMKFTTYGLNELEQQPQPYIYEAVLQTIVNYYGTWVVDVEELYDGIMRTYPQFVMLATLQVLITLDDILRNRYENETFASNANMSTGTSISDQKDSTETTSTSTDRETLTSETAVTGVSQSDAIGKLHTTNATQDTSKANIKGETSQKDETTGQSFGSLNVGATGGLNTELVIPLPELASNAGGGNFNLDEQGTPLLINNTNNQTNNNRYATAGIQSNNTQNAQTTNTENNDNSQNTGETATIGINEEQGYNINTSRQNTQNESVAVQKDDTLGINTLSATNTANINSSTVGNVSSNNESQSSGLQEQNVKGFTTSAIVGQNYSSLLQSYLGVNIYNWLLSEFAWIKGAI